MSEYDLYETLEHTMMEVGDIPVMVDAEDGKVEFKWVGRRFEVIFHPWSPNDDQAPVLIIAVKPSLMTEEEKAEWAAIDPEDAAKLEGDVYHGIEVAEIGSVLFMPIAPDFWDRVHQECHALMRPVPHTSGHP